MSTAGIVVIVVIVALLVVAAVATIVRRRRRKDLQHRFGPEYDRVVGQSKNRLEAERELERRQQRHEQLAIRPLSPERRQVYLGEWQAVQAMFVDAPSRALREADNLVQRVMVERGYPVSDTDRQIEDLSVEHADVVTRYRAAHAVAERNRTGSVTEDDLRDAMLDYRAMFSELVTDDYPSDGDTPSDRRTPSARSRRNA